MIHCHVNSYAKGKKDALAGIPSRPADYHPHISYLQGYKRGKATLKSQEKPKIKIVNQPAVCAGCGKKGFEKDFPTYDVANDELFCSDKEMDAWHQT